MLPERPQFGSTITGPEEENKVEGGVPEKKLDEFIENKNLELNNIITTTPKKIEFSTVQNNESYEIDVDLVNHVSASGGLEKFKMEILDKGGNNYIVNPENKNNVNTTNTTNNNIEVKKIQENNMTRMSNLQIEIDNK